MRSLITVEQQSVRLFPRFKSSRESSHDQIGSIVFRDLVRKDLSRKQIDDDTNCIEFACNPHICHIAHPNQIGSSLPKLLFQFIPPVHVFSI